MSDTPRTDALLDPVKGTVAFTGFCAEHARTLERENAAMLEAIGEAERWLAYYRKFVPPMIEMTDDEWADTSEGKGVISALSKLQPFLKP